jgi:hypothetical protein
MTVLDRLRLEVDQTLMRQVPVMDMWLSRMILGVGMKTEQHAERCQVGISQMLKTNGAFCC